MELEESRTPVVDDGKPQGYAALRLVLIYAVVASLWILLSDQALTWLFRDPAQTALAGTIKGWFFVAVTSLLLYGLIRRLLTQVHAVAQREQEALSRNIAERKLAEDALRDRDFRLSAIIGHSPSALSLKHPDGRYALANPNLQRIHHCAEEEIIGKSDFDLYPEETARRLRANDEVVVRTRARHSIEEIIPVDGQLRTFMSHMFSVPDAAGQLRYICRISLDITERKRHEEKVQAAMIEVEQANNAKSRFLAAASHDLRQPLTALSIYTKILSGKAAPSDQKMLGSMQECVVGLSNLLNDLLDLSKLAAGVVQAKVDDIPLAELFDGLQAIHGPVAELRRLRLRCVPTRLTVRTDPVLLRRILGNFIDNAVRYTERGGVVIGCRRRQGNIWIEVWDSGCGIPDDKRSEIFEEFRQLGDEARTRGSGLGLAIVAKTAALLGLEVRVRSWLGRGSVFSIEVPPGQARICLAQPASAMAHRPLRIALVDDNRLVGEAVAAALNEAGHHVISAASRDEILAALDTQAPDAVVSDYRLAQGLTGYDVITAIRARFGAALPAMIITGDTEPGLLRTMSERGIHVLHKPVDMEMLLNHLVDITSPAMA